MIQPQQDMTPVGALQLVFKDIAALHASYISLFSDGGLFVPTAREHMLGDDINVMISLPDDEKHSLLRGVVAWITPAHASGGRLQGVGLRFVKDQNSQQLKARIEALLGPLLASTRATQTI